MEKCWVRCFASWSWGRENLAGFRVWSLDLQERPKEGTFCQSGKGNAVECSHQTTICKGQPLICGKMLKAMRYHGVTTGLVQLAQVGAWLEAPGWGQHHAPQGCGEPQTHRRIGSLAYWNQSGPGNTLHVKGPWGGILTPDSISESAVGLCSYI
jgi:hypothetical protein